MAAPARRMATVIRVRYGRSCPRNLPRLPFCTRQVNPEGCLTARTWNSAAETPVKNSVLLRVTPRYIQN